MRNHRKLMQLIKANCQTKDAPSYRVQQRSPLANSNENRPALLMYDVIDPWWGISAEMVKASLLDIPNATDIDVYLNSPGGDVFEATAIHSALISHPANIHIHIDGYAASAATRVAMAGDTIEIAESGMYMIHYAWTLAMGNAAELRSTADMLDQVDNTIVADYVKGANADEKQIRDWMAAETWFTAEQAVEHGFVQSVIQRNNTENRLNNKAWDFSAYQNAPKPKPPEDLFPQRERLERFANMLQITA
jgi:ATP-dependent Clp protease protease subunit